MRIGALPREQMGAWLNLLSLATPFDPAVKHVDILLGQARAIGEVHRFGGSFGDRLDRNVDAVLSEKRCDCLGPRARQPYIQLGGPAHVGVTDKENPGRPLLLQGGTELTCGLLADISERCLPKNE